MQLQKCTMIDVPKVAKVRRKMCEVDENVSAYCAVL